MIAMINNVTGLRVFSLDTATEIAPRDVSRPMGASGFSADDMDESNIEEERYNRRGAGLGAVGGFPFNPSDFIPSFYPRLFAICPLQRVMAFAR